MMVAMNSLRGGGVICSCNNKVAPTIKEQQMPKVFELLSSKFNKNIQIIKEKASLAANQYEYSEIMISIQWFFFQEKTIYKLNKSVEGVKKSYDLILEGIKSLLNSCLIYIRTDSFICLYILQITTSLSKVIFSFHLMNDERFMTWQDKKDFQQICEKIRVQIEIEKNDLIQNQIELYLFLTQVAFDIAPINSDQQKKILVGCFKSIIKSIIEMKLDFDLFVSLFEGAQLFYEEITNDKQINLYELYYQLDTMLWEVIINFKNNNNIDLESIIKKIDAMHSKIVKGSVSWKDHYLWIQMIGKIIIFNPLLTKKRLKKIIFSENLAQKIWKDLNVQGFLIQRNYSKESAVISLNQLENKKITKIEKQVFEFCFEGWKNFTQLKEFLMDEQSKNTQYTFGAYLKSQLDLGNKDDKVDQNILAKDKISKFLSIIVSDKFLEQINRNFQIFDEAVHFLRIIKIDQIVDVKIKQISFKTKIQKLIKNFEESYQNIQHILKIFQLIQQQKEQCQQNENIFYASLRYLRLLEKTLEQALRQMNLRSSQKQNQLNQKQKEILDAECEFLRNQTKLIKDEFKNLNFNEEQFKNLDDQLSKLLKNESEKQFSSEAKKILENINQLKQQKSKEMKEIIKKDGIVTSFENMLLRLQHFCKQQFQLIKQDFQSSIVNFREIFIKYHEIQSVSSTDELNKIEKEFQKLLFLENINDQRFNYLKLNIQLICFKEFCYELLALAKPEELKELLKIIEFNKFLVDAIKNYPLMNNFDIKVKDIVNEIKSLNITDINKKNQLLKQQGIIQYLIYILQLEGQIVCQQRQDLELIRKEFGEKLFLQSKSIQSIEIIQIIKTLKIEKNFKQDQLKIEKEKYEKLLKELKKILGSQKNQEETQLINLAEKVVITIRDSENKLFSIACIPIQTVLKELEEQFEKVQKNKQESSSSESSISNPSITNLDNLIKLLKQQNNDLIKQKEILEKIYEHVKQLFDQFEFIENQQKQQIQVEMLNSFNDDLEIKIKSFQKWQKIQQGDEQIKQQNSAISTDCSQIKFKKKTKENEHKVKIESQLIKTNNFDISLYLQLKSKVKEQLVSSNYSLDEVEIKEEFFITQIKRLYFGEQEDIFEIFDVEDKQYQDLGFFETYIQKLRDFKNNQQWKIKQGLVFTIIQISSNCFSDKIISFCQQALVQLWAKEKDQRIRNLLKNQTLISKQIQILSRDWNTQQEKISSEMKFMLRKIDDLQGQIANEDNLNEREKKLIELDENTQQLEEYIQNIDEMGQQLRLITDFLNHLRKGLTRVEGKIDDMKHQLNNMSYDIKFLRGKSVNELFEIRKLIVLKDAAMKNLKSIYIPLKTQEKKEDGDWESESNLINLEQLEQLEQLDGKNGKVQEFLLGATKKQVLLIHGIAGSGKSTAAKKIEEFIWKLHGQDILFNNKILIPIYISLPSLNNPVFQAVEEALHSVEYGFDELQLRECKEMLKNNKFRLLLIFDGYDEMNLQNIQKNIYKTNKLCQNWYDPLVIFTTRSEFFSSQNYADWFVPENKNQLKEVKLLKFGQEQINQYLEKFTFLSIKMIIYDQYEQCNQICNFDEKKFQSFRKNMKSELQKKILLQINSESESLLNERQIQSILLFLKNEKIFGLRNNETIRNLKVNLQNLWSVEQYENIIKKFNIDKILETPYLMEIIFWVLPAVIAKATKIENLQQNFIKNFSKMVPEALQSQYLIKKYKEQKKILMIQNNKNEQGTNFNRLQDLEKIDYHQVAYNIWQKLEQKQILTQFQINIEFNRLKEELQQNFEDDFQTMFLPDQKVEIDNNKMFQLVYDALNEQNLTSFDFYDEFIVQHYLKQIEKQRNLGKSININRFLYDLQQYSINLAKQMSERQLTQIEYKQQGLLYKDYNKQDDWIKEFFDDDGQEGQYKKDVRSCSLVYQKGSYFQFVHKSIQEFLIAADLYNLLVLSKKIDFHIFSKNIEILQKQDQAQDFLFNSEKVNHQIICLINDFKDHDFNKINYSSEIYYQTRKFLIQKISKDNQISECLKFFVRLTAIDERFIQSGSNSLNLLVQMQVDLTQQDYQNIKIKNTSIAGGNFAECNFNGSEFLNVNINAVNLNRAILSNCKWKNIRLNELHKLIGHNECVNSLCFSPDGTKLASGGKDKSICLWDVKEQKEIGNLQGHTDSVFSVCFSPDSTILASGSSDNSIIIWNVGTKQQTKKLKEHKFGVNSVCFSPNGTILASGSEDKSIRLWDVKEYRERANLKGHTESVFSVSFSPDGTKLASGSGDKSIRLWNVQLGQQTLLIEKHEDEVKSVNFSPDGKRLASGSMDQSIRQWEIETGKQLKIDKYGVCVLSVCFSPDNSTLVSGGGENSIRLWDVKIEKQTSLINGHSQGVVSLCFSPDGITLASGSKDKSIFFLDVKTGMLKQKFDGLSGEVNSICFSPDGTLLASGSSDNLIHIWKVKTGKKTLPLKGHNGQVSSVCFSPDGTTLASGSYDNSIHLWNVERGEPIIVKLMKHQGYVLSVKFSPDGCKLASSSGDKSIRLWDVKEQKEIANLQGHTDSVFSVCFSPDSTTLASGSLDNSIIIWDVGTKQQTKKLKEHKFGVNSVCFSPDGTILASGSRDESILLWDVKTGNQKSKLTELSGGISSLCFSPDGTILASSSIDQSIHLWDIQILGKKYSMDIESMCFSYDGFRLATVSQDQSIRIWDVKTNQQIKEIPGHIDKVSSVCFSPDGLKLAFGSFDKTICLWDIETGEQLQKIDGLNSNILSVCFSPDGTLLASGSSDNLIHLWNVKTGKKTSELEGHGSKVLSVCFSPDGITLASGSFDQTICLWNIEKGEQLKKIDLKKIDGLNSNIQSLCFSPDSTLLIFGSKDRIWNIKTGQQTSELRRHSIGIWQEKQLDGQINGVLSVCFASDGTILASESMNKQIFLWNVKIKKLNGHTSRISSICFSSDSTLLASGSQDKSIYLWNVKVGQQISELKGHEEEVSSVCFSPDATILASGSLDTTICFWNVEKKKEQFLLKGHNSGVISVCFSPDGTKLASGSYDNSIILWKVKTGELIVKLMEHQGQVLSVKFSPDGCKLASGSGDKSIRVWDVKEQKQIANLKGHTDSVFSVCFSPDGITLASGSYDNSIILWNVERGEQTNKLEGHQYGVNSVCFSPDGTTLASGSEDESICLWDVKTGNQKQKLTEHRGGITSLCFSPDSTILASSSQDRSICLFYKYNDRSYKEIYEKINNHLFNHENINQARLVICKDKFQAKGTLIFQGEILNHQNIDLRLLFKQKGSIILENRYR